MGADLPESSTTSRGNLGVSGNAVSRGVLIVESDPDLQWQLARMLTQASCVVVGTSSSDGALAVLSSWSADVIVVAEDLPGMNGLELVRHIRSMKADVPILLLANDGPGVDEVVKATGATKVMVKPVKLDELRQLVVGIDLVHR
jgi:DNA-binding response OmpR family regulator